MNSHSGDHHGHRRAPPPPPVQPRFLPPQQWQPRHPPPPHVVLSAMNRPWPPHNGTHAPRPPPPIQNARPPWPPRPAPLLNQLHPHRSHLGPQQTSPYNQRRFARPPPPQVDPEALWLAGFAERHLHSSPSTDEQAGNGDHEAPLRRIRRRLLEMQTLLDELETSANDLVDLENKVNCQDTHDGLDVARLKLQVDRKRARCEELRSKLELLQEPMPLGLGADLKRDVVAFTKRIQKKKLYRQRQAEKCRAERRIRQGLDEKVTPVPRENEADERKQTVSANAIGSTSADSGGTLNASGQTPEGQSGAREIAQKVLLILELQKKRNGDEVAENEKLKLEQIREQMTSCLAEKPTRKRKRKRKPRLRSSSAADSNEKLSSTGTTTMPSATVLQASSTRSRVLPLTDPYPLDMETLISLRRQWDSHLVPAKVNGASTIPPNFVEPPMRPSDHWAHYYSI